MDEGQPVLYPLLRVYAGMYVYLYVSVENDLVPAFCTRKLFL